MSADLIDQPASAAATGHDTAKNGNDAARHGHDTAKNGNDAARHGHDTAGRQTGTSDQLAADEIHAIRERIDAIDQALIDLWLERSHLSQQVGRTRMASGGTRLVLSREREIVERFREALGPDGTQVALLLLRAGRGPL